MIKKDLNTWYEVSTPECVFKLHPLVSTLVDDEEHDQIDQIEIDAVEAFNMRLIQACTDLCVDCDTYLYQTKRLVDHDIVPF